MAALLAQRASSTLAASRAGRPSKALMAPKAALMTDVKPTKASRKSSNPKPAGFELGFTKDNEVFVGRLAMMGFASSVVGEVLSGGQGALAQLSYLYGLPEAQVGIFLAGLVAFNLVAGLLPNSGTFKPEEVAAMEAEEGPIKNPKITVFQIKKFFGVTDWGFTPQNELFAGRMAQLGFAASLIGEVLTGMGPLGQFSAGAVWQERFHRAALELIAVITSSTSGRADRLAAAAATDAAAPALLKIERAAIAAATPISYQPQELLLLIYEHLKASGLHSAAASLAKEAGLAGSKTHSQAAAAAQQQQISAGAVASGLAGSMSPVPAGLIAGSCTAQHSMDGPVGAATATPFAAPGKGILASSSGSDSAAGAGVGAGTASKDRRKTLSLGPGLLQHLTKEPSLEPEQQHQQQSAQQQQHSRLSLGQPNSAPGPGPGSSSVRRQPTPPPGSGTFPGSTGSANTTLMSPPLPVTSGAKRRAVAAAAAATTITGAAVTSCGFEIPPAKRQAVVDSSTAAGPGNMDQQPAAGQAADKQLSSATIGSSGGLGPLQLPQSPHLNAGTPVPSTGSKRGSRAAAAAGSDADYIRNLGQLQGLGLFHSQAPPATPQAAAAGTQQHTTATGLRHAASSSGASPHAGAAAASGSQNVFSSPSPGLWTGFTPVETPAGAGFSTDRGLVAGSGTPTLPSMPSPSGTPSAAAAAAAAANQAAAVPPGVNPLLTHLPSRQLGKPGGGLQRRLSGGTELPHRMTSIAEAVPEPKPLPLHVQVAARDVMTGPPVNSRLGGIVTAYLRQQHRAACLASAQPVSVVPPVSLLKPYALPVASRPLQAPANVSLRRARQEVWGGFGGRGGAAATRRLVWSRFRLTQTLRDDGPLLTACTFLRGFELLVAGTASGELKLHDAYSGEHVELIDAHSSPISLLQASNWHGGAPGDQMLASSSRNEVLLWRADGFDTGPLYSWPGLTRGRFSPAVQQLVGVAVGSSPRQAKVYDIHTGEVIATLDEAAAAAVGASAAGVSSGAAGGGAAAGSGAAGGEYVRGAASACFSPSGELVLWGATLWDPRVPIALHTFDQLSAGGTGGCFHPNGAEIILNSEVWDLRNRKLLRSVPVLDGTSITFNSSGDVLCAWLRRPADDSMAALLQPKRRRHPLATSFTSLDARSYSEIGSVQVERAVLDLCLDPSDSYLAAVAVDIGGGLEGSISSSVRLYEVGRQRPMAGEEDDDSVGEGDESEDDEDEDGDEGGGLQALLGRDDDGGLGGARDDGDNGSEGDEGENGEAEDEADLEFEDGMTLEEAIADMYEEAVAAGIDPEEFDIDVESGEEDDEGEFDDDEEDDLLDALEGSSSEYETDEEA